VAAVEPPEQRGAEDPNTVGCLITRYLARPEFKTDLAPRMRKLFRGWSIDYCQSIVDVYLPRRTEVALTAIELWEKAPQADSKVVNLGLTKRR